MADIFTKEQRSKTMAAIKSKNTSPEMKVRKLLHGAGYRYRLHSKHLPGKPDLVFSKYQAVIFVHGCYWHHHGCHISHVPESNTEYWHSKIKRNLERDKQHIQALLNNGWRVMVIWECAIRGKTMNKPDVILKAVQRWLQSHSAIAELKGNEPS